MFWVRRDFVFFVSFCFFERTRPVASIRPACLIYLFTSNIIIRARRRFDRAEGPAFPLLVDTHRHWPTQAFTFWQRKKPQGNVLCMIQNVRQHPRFEHQRSRQQGWLSIADPYHIMLEKYCIIPLHLLHTVFSSLVPQFMSVGGAAAALLEPHLAIIAIFKLLVPLHKSHNRQKRIARQLDASEKRYTVEASCAENSVPWRCYRCSLCGFQSGDHDGIRLTPPLYM